MNDYNKVLWIIFLVALNGLISLGLREIKSKKLRLTLLMVFVVALVGVSVCWVHFDFWK